MFTQIIAEVPIDLKPKVVLFRLKCLAVNAVETSDTLIINNIVLWEENCVASQHTAVLHHLFVILFFTIFVVIYLQFYGGSLWNFCLFYL